MCCDASSSPKSLLISVTVNECVELSTDRYCKLIDCVYFYVTRTPLRPLYIRLCWSFIVWTLNFSRWFATLLFVSQLRGFTCALIMTALRKRNASLPIDLLSFVLLAFIVGEMGLAGVDYEAWVGCRSSMQTKPPTDELAQPKLCLLSIRKQNFCAFDFSLLIDS